MVIPGQTTLGTIRQTVRQRTDIPSTAFITDPELNGYINSSALELYGILGQKYGNDYYLSGPFIITTDGLTDSFALPPDFFKARMVDWLWNGNPGWRSTMSEYALIERNMFASPYYVWAPTSPPPGYRIERNLLVLQRFGQSPPPSGNTIELTYLPRMTPLADSGTITCSSVQPNDSVTINGTQFQAVSYAPGPGTLFQIGADDATTATNLAAAIQASGLFLGSASGNVVTVTPPSSTVVTWSSFNVAPAVINDLAIYPPTTWSNTLDGVNGWEEYVVADACIKCVAKREWDPSVFMQQKAALLLRLDSETESRNAASPKTVADSRNSNMSGFGGFYGSF